MRKGLFRKKNIMVYLLCGLLLLTGCGGSSTEEVPELMDSLVNNDAYRPVTYGTIGNIGNLEDACGVVVPQEDCYFFNATAEIENINVSVGDYVEAGEVLATIRLDEIEQSIQDLQTSLEYRQSIHTQEQKIYDETMEKYDYQIQAYQEATERTGAKQAISDLKVSKAVEKENHFYSEMLYERECRLLKEEISEQQELLTEGKLIARNSGYVIYTKDLSDSAETQVAENVVIVADYSKKYLEVDDYTMDDTTHTEAESVYTSYNGTRHDLSLYTYSQDELAMMQATKEFPYIKYELPDGIDAEIGDLLPVCYTKKNVPNVLIIGLDSVYQEGNDTFVYVKTEKNDKERRDITTGSKDQHYIEVTSGLEEGELVYYSSTAMTPANYQSVKVELSDFSIKAKTAKYILDNARTFNIYADDDVTVTEVMVAEGDTVNEGDLVLRILAEGGKADLLAASNAVTAEEESYEQTSADYRQQIKDIDKQIKAAKAAQKELTKSLNKSLQQTKGLGTILDQTENTTSEQAEDVTGETTEESTELVTEEPVEDETEASTEEPAEVTTEEPTEEQTEEQTEEEEQTTISAAQLYQVEQLECDKKIATAAYRIATLSHEQALKQLQETYNTLKADNEGNGYRNIYAERAGVVTKLYAQTDKKIKEGEILYIVSQETTDKLYVTMAAYGGVQDYNGKEGAKLNQEITFVNDDKTYTGVCIAGQARPEKTYYTTLDGKVYSSSVNNNFFENGGNESFYVRMEDESFYESMDATEIVFDAISMKNAIVLPLGMVYAETDKLSGQTYSYVWKIMDGNLVKQYVTVSTTMQSGSQVVVLAGVEVGDELAWENATVSGEEDE